MKVEVAIRGCTHVIKFDQAKQENCQVDVSGAECTGVIKFDQAKQENCSVTFEVLEESSATVTPIDHMSVVTSLTWFIIGFALVWVGGDMYLSRRKK